MGSAASLKAALEGRPQARVVRRERIDRRHKPDVGGEQAPEFEQTSLFVEVSA